MFIFVYCKMFYLMVLFFQQNYFRKIQQLIKAILNSKDNNRLRITIRTVIQTIARISFQDTFRERQVPPHIMVLKRISRLKVFI